MEKVDCKTWIKNFDSMIERARKGEESEYEIKPALRVDINRMPGSIPTITYHDILVKPRIRIVNMTGELVQIIMAVPHLSKEIRFHFNRMTSKVDHYVGGDSRRIITPEGLYIIFEAH